MKRKREQPIRVGIVGYGKIGKFLVDQILGEFSSQFELAFVWNRTFGRVEEDVRISADQQLENLNEFASKNADIIVEVAHPDISRTFGPQFLEHAHYLVGSPTCMANAETEASLLKAAADELTGFGLHVPAGALWGAVDIQKMSARGTLTGLSVTMRFAPDSLKLQGRLKEELEKVKAEYTTAKRTGETLLYEGSVRGLCPLAPNNVNTMACAAIAARECLGMERTTGRLICDPSLDAHIIDVEVRGPSTFKVNSNRYNPAKKGAVTGNATYMSFMSSLIAATRYDKGDGIHFC